MPEFYIVMLCLVGLSTTVAGIIKQSVVIVLVGFVILACGVALIYFIVNEEIEQKRDECEQIIGGEFIKGFDYDYCILGTDVTIVKMG